MIQSREFLAVLAAVSTAGVLCLAHPVQGQPSAGQVLTDMGWSAGDKQRVLNGEFVTADVPGVSDKDLSLAIAFLVKTSPEDLSTQIMTRNLIISTDSQVQASGELSNAGSLADLAGLQITGNMAQTLSNAQAGEALNLSTGEIAAFNALQGGTQQAVQRQLQQMLLARCQAYKASGLAGIAPYDRSGSTTDVGGGCAKPATPPSNCKSTCRPSSRCWPAIRKPRFPGCGRTSIG